MAEQAPGGCRHAAYISLRFEFVHLRFIPLSADHSPTTQALLSLLQRPRSFLPYIVEFHMTMVAVVAVDEDSIAGASLTIMTYHDEERCGRYVSSGILPEFSQQAGRDAYVSAHARTRARKHACSRGGGRRTTRRARLSARRGARDGASADRGR